MLENPWALLERSNSLAPQLVHSVHGAPHSTSISGFASAYAPPGPGATYGGSGPKPLLPPPHLLPPPPASSAAVGAEAGSIQSSSTLQSPPASSRPPQLSSKLFTVPTLPTMNESSGFSTLLNPQ